MKPAWSAIPALALALLGLAGCASAPSGPCLGYLPIAVTLPYGRMEVMSWESDGSTELVRFQFDPSVPGTTTATVEPAGDGPFIGRAFAEPVQPGGVVLTSVRLEGLDSVGQVDQLSAGEGDPSRIREIVPVQDASDLRVIVGTAAGQCLRLAADPSSARISLLITDGS